MSSQKPWFVRPNLTDNEYNFALILRCINLKYTIKKCKC